MAKAFDLTQWARPEMLALAPYCNAATNNSIKEIAKANKKDKLGTRNCSQVIRIPIFRFFSNDI